MKHCALLGVNTSAFNSSMFSCIYIVYQKNRKPDFFP